MGGGLTKGSEDSGVGGADQQGASPSPEHLVGDVVLCDPAVHQVLVPHGIQCVPLRLGFQLIGLRCGDNEFSEHVP